MNLTATADAQPADIVPMLRVDEIRWTPDVRPFLDLLGMSDEDVFVESLRDGESYRLLAQMAIHRLHDLQGELDRLRQSHHRLRDEYRRLRATHLEAA